MGQQARVLDAGDGWSVADVLCSCGPQDPLFSERHDGVCIAAVLSGQFQYRGRPGAAHLVPGALLLGNHEAEFECGHPYGSGDRCLSFNLSAAFFAAVAATVPGLRRADFTVPELPPQVTRVPHLAAAAAAADGDAVALRDLTVRFVADAIAMAVTGDAPPVTPTGCEEMAVARALRRMTAETALPEELTLAALADAARMMPFRFLRVFHRIVGMTPHQYLLFWRLSRAAMLLRHRRVPVAEAAFAAGFGDLSTFNRRFRRVMGVSPRRYRDAAPTVM